ncbi:MAG TPA: TonB family protein [Bryobacteraceae bacterium]|nr:TonB family protein [Bryobacteraceae bacterium]
MRPYVDILDERESLRGPFVQSVVLHVGVAGLLVLSGISYQRSREVWGSANTQAGDVVHVTPVNIPLPSRSGIVNPVANDTESQVPQVQLPKPQPKKQVKAPEPKAIPLKSRHVDTRSLEQISPQRYRPQAPLPNQVLSSEPPAAVSPMYEKPGSGGVGIGPNSVFGNRFGGYADLVIKRVTDKWQTSGLAGLHTAPMVIVTFDILRDGSVRNAKVAQRSGNDALDYSALRAVMDAGPFPPLPAEYNRSEANVELRFQLQR